MRTVVRNSYTPKTGDYCNMIVLDQDNQMQYIFDSDGVFTNYTSKQQEGAPLFYVDSAVNGAINSCRGYTDTKSAQVLQEAKDYTDQHGGGSGDATKTYVDAQDAVTLGTAKAYTDSVVNFLSASEVELSDPANSRSLAFAVDVANKTISVTKGNDIVTTPSRTSDLINNGSDGNSLYVEQSELATVAMTGSYNNLTDKPAIPTITMTTTDPGEGAALAANTFIGVYS